MSVRKRTLSKAEKLGVFNVCNVCFSTHLAVVDNVTQERWERYASFFFKTNRTFNVFNVSPLTQLPRSSLLQKRGKLSTAKNTHVASTATAGHRASIRGVQ